MGTFVDVAPDPGRFARNFTRAFRTFYEPNWSKARQAILYAYPHCLTAYGRASATRCFTVERFLAGNGCGATELNQNHFVLPAPSSPAKAAPRGMFQRGVISESRISPKNKPIKSMRCTIKKNTRRCCGAQDRRTKLKQKMHRYAALRHEHVAWSRTHT